MTWTSKATAWSAPPWIWAGRLFLKNKVIRSQLSVIRKRRLVPITARCSLITANCFTGGSMAKGYNRPPMGKGGGGGMMGQLRKLQEQMEQAQAALAESSVTGTSGGGVVKVTVTGDKRCTKVEID